MEKDTPVKTISVIPGDGIGIEVTQVALEIVESLELDWELQICEGGWSSWLKYGSPIPEQTWSSIRSSDALLLGATTSKPKREAMAELPPELIKQAESYVSPIVQLRQKLDLYANVRPQLDENFDTKLLVVRENTEGLYSGFDYSDLRENAVYSLVKSHRNVKEDPDGRISGSIRLQTEFAMDRILNFACETAKSKNISTVTVADKPNVLRESSSVLRDCVDRASKKFPDVRISIENVDAVALWMVRRPERFGLIVAENMFGDILSDLSAGLSGGLGVAPSANYGENFAYFEPVHGSAPSRAGRGIANPTAMILSVALMAQYLGYDHVSTVLRRALQATLLAGVSTYDQGGDATTKEFGKRVIKEVRGLR